MVIPLRGIVALARLHNQPLLLRGQVNLAIAGVGIGTFRRVAKAVLMPQVVFDLLIDLGERILFRDLEHAPAGLTGDLVKDLLPVGAAAELNRNAPASTEAATAAVHLRILEENAVDQRI